MLAHAKLSRTYWAEVVLTAIHIINRSPSVPLDADVSQRVWINKDVSCRHLRVFSCLSYVHIVKDQRRKLDPKRQPCIFLGCGEDEFNYWLWDLIDNKFMRNRE